MVYKISEFCKEQLHISEYECFSPHILLIVTKAVVLDIALPEFLRGCVPVDCKWQSTQTCLRKKTRTQSGQESFTERVEFVSIFHSPPPYHLLELALKIGRIDVSFRVLSRGKKRLLPNSSQIKIFEDERLEHPEHAGQMATIGAQRSNRLLCFP